MFLINYKIFFYLWVTVHLTLLVISGYLNKVALALSMKNMNAFVEVHTFFYPVQTQNITNYDITEFTVFYAIGSLCVLVIRRWSTARRQQFIRYL